MKDLDSLAYYRLMLAPLRFGAGIKGKICDAWYQGLPCITTPIGAEGMFLNTYNNNKDYETMDLDARFFKPEKTSENSQKTYFFNENLIRYYQYEKNCVSHVFSENFGGSFENFSVEDFVENSVKIYQDKEIWLENSKKGFEIVKKRMGFLMNEALLMRKFAEKMAALKTERKKNHVQAMTWNETMRSTEHFAKYVSLKNATKKTTIK